MKINFSDIPEQRNEAFKGGDKYFCNKVFSDTANKIMRGRLVPSASIGMHTHETNSEIMFILKGNGRIIFDGETFPLHEGECHYCPKGHTHSLINDGDCDLELFAVVPEQ